MFKRIFKKLKKNNKTDLKRGRLHIYYFGEIINDFQKAIDNEEYYAKGEYENLCRIFNKSGLFVSVEPEEKDWWLIEQVIFKSNSDSSPEKMKIGIDCYDSGLMQDAIPLDEEEYTVAIYIKVFSFEDFANRIVDSFKRYYPFNVYSFFSTDGFYCKLYLSDNQQDIEQLHKLHAGG